MKKLMVCYVFVFMFIIAIIYCYPVNSIRINEIELNPAGEDRGNEWLELYSEQETNLDGWKIMNIKYKNISLNESFSGFKIIYTPYAFLSNEKQRFYLINPASEIVQETPEISDNYNDNRSWQFCSEWIFAEASRGEENNCKKEQEKQEENDKEINSTINSRIISKEDEEQEKEINEKSDEQVSSENDKIEEVISDEGNKEEVKIIKLEKDIKSNKIWKSRTRYIKEYSLFGFTLFLIILLVIMIKWKKFVQQ